MKENKSNSLIEGDIGKAILFFVLPLIAGSLIQQLYVTVDAIIVGRFAGKVGLAAIDSINTLFKFPINFMNGGGRSNDYYFQVFRSESYRASASFDPYGGHDRICPGNHQFFRRRTACSATAETDACSGGYLQGYADILHDLFRWSVVPDPLSCVPSGIRNVRCMYCL